jgi:tetratricopeptide (TPR) repeat protein
MKVPAAALIVAAMLTAWPARASAQNPWVVEWLREYQSGGDARAAVFDRLRTIGNIRQLNDDLDTLLEDWLKEGESPDAQRRAISAFAIEVAATRLGSGKAAADLIEWGCRQVRRIRAPGEFERQFHLAAFALFGGLVDPDAIESHAGHMRLQFRSEPRLLYERAVAEELRAAPFFEGGKASERDVQKRNEEAAKRYAEAAKQPGLEAEARLRLGHVEVALGRYAVALTTLDGLEKALDDPDLQYLTHLFRGQALAHLDQLDAAGREFRAALTVRPGAQSASMALAAQLFRNGERGEADRIVAALLDEVEVVSDPWWTYWPADYRHAAQLLAAMRNTQR